MLAKYRLKLNPEKCVFGIEAGKFSGFEGASLFSVFEEEQ